MLKSRDNPCFIPPAAIDTPRSRGGALELASLKFTDRLSSSTVVIAPPPITINSHTHLKTLFVPTKMVKVEEVAEKYADQLDRESDYITDDGEDVDFDSDDVSSVASDDVDDAFDIANETLRDRVAALKDIVSPSTRLELARRWSSIKGWTFTGSKWAGNAIWVVTTSAILVGLPLALAIEDEARIVQQEKELQMQQSGQQSVSCSDWPHHDKRTGGDFFRLTTRVSSRSFSADRHQRRVVSKDWFLRDSKDGGGKKCGD